MSNRPLRSWSPSATPGGTVILRPDFAACRRAAVGSPAHLAVQADALFARMMTRRRATPAKPGAAEAALTAIAAGIEPAPAVIVPGFEAASWQPCPFIDPSAGLAALAASLAVVTGGARAPSSSACRPPTSTARSRACVVMA